MSLDLKRLADLAAGWVDSQITGLTPQQHLKLAGSLAGLLEDTARDVRAVSLAEKRAEIVKRLEELAAGDEIHAAFYPGIDDNVAKIQAAARAEGEKEERERVVADLRDVAKKSAHDERGASLANYCALRFEAGEHTKGTP